MTEAEMPKVASLAVLAGTDLMFSSKVRGAADPLGIQVTSLRNSSSLAELLRGAFLFMVDVSSNKIDPIALIAEASGLRSSGAFTGTIVAFGPHVEVDLLEKAREAGSDVVLTRSQFVEELPQLLRGSPSASDKSAPSLSSPHVQRAERGAGKFTVLVFGMISAAVLYTAYFVLPFYYYYYEIQNQFEQIIAVAATEPDMEIRKRLWYYVRKYELPAIQEDLLIERDGRNMHIKLTYEEVFSVYWESKEYVLWRFPFTAEASGEF